MLKNTVTTYGSVAKFFHWLIFLLVLFMLIYGYCLDDFSKENQALAYNIHKLIGLTLLCLVLLRILWALCNPKPILPLETPQWMAYGARILHLLIYATMIAMPLVGWIGSSAAGRAPHLGNITIRFPIEESKELAKQAMTLHGQIALLLIALISLHVLAALYHHFIRKDNVLKTMMPFSKE